MYKSLWVEFRNNTLGNFNEWIRPEHGNLPDGSWVSPFQIASIYGYLYVKFQWGKSKRFRSSFDISWAGNFTMKVDVYMSYWTIRGYFLFLQLGFQSLLLSLLSCVCCFFCWRVNDNGSILIPQQVDHSNIFHIAESLHPKAVAPSGVGIGFVRFIRFGWMFFSSQLRLNHIVHLTSCWMFLLNSCNHTWRLVEVMSFPFPGNNGAIWRTPWK